MSLRCSASQPRNLGGELAHLRAQRGPHALTLALLIDVGGKDRELRTCRTHKRTSDVMLLCTEQ